MRCALIHVTCKAKVLLPKCGASMDQGQGRAASHKPCLPTTTPPLPPRKSAQYTAKKAEESAKISDEAAKEAREALRISEQRNAAISGELAGVKEQLNAKCAEALSLTHEVERLTKNVRSFNCGITLRG
jgi:hypothetical protein